MMLAYFLHKSNLRDSSIAIIDNNFGARQDKAWSYWLDHSTPFDNLTRKVWHNIHVYGSHFARSLPLERYHFAELTSQALYTFIAKELAGASIEYVNAHVHKIVNTHNHATVLTDIGDFTGSWVFDSTFDWQVFQKSRLLNLHGLGWMVTSRLPSFDASSLIFFDFRLPYRQPVFFYVMPYSTTYASITCTFIDPAARSAPLVVYQGLLKEYVESVLKIHHYTKTEDIINAIPLSDYSYPRRLGKHTMAIGTKGGRVKATTSFGYTRIMADSQAIVKSLIETGQPFYPEASSLASRILDALTVKAIQKNPACIEQLFTQLFQQNDADEILGFLSEANSLSQNIKILRYVDPRPFLSGLF